MLKCFIFYKTFVFEFLESHLFVFIKSDKFLQCTSQQEDSSVYPTIDT